MRKILNQYESLEVREQGLRFADILRIQPASGSEKIVPLKRTKYLVQSKRVSEASVASWTILLPSFTGRASSYELKLIPQVKNTDIENHGRFLFECREGAPFKINGNFSYKSWLMRGDKIDIGYNRLLFSGMSERAQVGDTVVDERLFDSPLNMLIQGETGTGKTRLAKIIHEKSRRSGEFVHLNLASFAPGLLESELFGHVKGAFTGASGDKLGAIRQANYGTLFLDEVDSLSLELQTKLLLFLEDFKVRPVGGYRDYKCDVRLIFASGRSLKSCVEEGGMRKDFYYRLSSGGVCDLPSLAQRPQLVEQICREFEQEKYCTISQQLIERYKKTQWPGNIRQLWGHLLKKHYLTNGSKLSVCPLDDELVGGKMAEGLSFDLLSLREMKHLYCLQTLERFSGSIVRASEVLGVSPNTVRNLASKKAA